MAGRQPQFLSFSSETLMPQEERLEVGRKKQDLYIGIPKETEYMEKRIALAPDAVDVLVRNGHRVRVESGAGEDASFSDKDYSDAGAEICYEPGKIFETQTILKVASANAEGNRIAEEQANADQCTAAEDPK